MRQVAHQRIAAGVVVQAGERVDTQVEQLGLGGRLAIDATTKIGPEKNHPWGEPLSRPADLEQRVTDRMEELGLSDVNNREPNPELFGYLLDQLIANQPVP